MRGAATAIAAALGLAVAHPAQAKTCADLFVTSTDETRADDAKVVRLQTFQKVAARNIGKVIDDGRWRLIWATPDAAERGVYFFRHTRDHGLVYANVWGGVIAPGEEAGVARWARGLARKGPDRRTVACFIEAVKAGD